MQKVKLGFPYGCDFENYVLINGLGIIDYLSLKYCIASFMFGISMHVSCKSHADNVLL